MEGILISIHSGYILDYLTLEKYQDFCSLNVVDSQPNMLDYSNFLLLVVLDIVWTY